MINLHTKFEVSIFSHHEDMKGKAKCGLWNLGVVWGRKTLVDRSTRTTTTKKKWRPMHQIGCRCRQSEKFAARSSDVDKIAVSAMLHLSRQLTPQFWRGLSIPWGWVSAGQEKGRIE